MTTQSDKAARLFQFLAQVRRLREHTTTDIKGFEDRGGVVWLSDVAHNTAANGWPVRVNALLWQRLGLLDADDDPGRTGDAVIIAAGRPKHMEAPRLPEKLKPWIEGASHNHRRRPSVKPDADEETTKQANYWLEKWDAWAAAKQYQDVYNTLFDAHINASQSSEEFELVLGLGLLAWAPGGKRAESTQINRHLFTVTVTSALDKTTGEIRYSLADGAAPLKAEVDFIPVEALQDRSFVKDITAKAAEYAGHIFDIELFDDLGVFTANSLSTSAVYLPRGRGAQPKETPVINWAPALILRKRQNTGFAVAYEKIAAEIEQSGTVPAGLLSLLDPDQEPPVVASDEPGAVVPFGEDIFSPLPLNDIQQRIIERVDQHSQVVVQGPPGTGKTHMAAALLSHFLAQGKRVLVTAEADRALYEVRDKLPEEIRELAVSVIGTSADDMSDLRLAVNRIARSAAEFDQTVSRRAINDAVDNLHHYQQRRAELLQQISAEIRRKTEPAHIPGYELPPGLLAAQVQEDSARYGWIWDYAIEVIVARGAGGVKKFPLSLKDIDRYCKQLIAYRDADKEQIEMTRRVDFDALPQPDECEYVVEALAGLNAQLESHRTGLTAEQWAALQASTEEARVAAREQAVKLNEQLERINRSGSAWVADFMKAYDAAELEAWRTSISQLSTRVHTIERLLLTIGAVKKISVGNNAADMEKYLPYAKRLRDYLNEKGPLKTDAHGQVKLGVFAPALLKDGKEFFAAVSVEGEQPSTAEQVEAVIAHIQLHWELDALRKEIPQWLPVSNDVKTAVMVARMEADLAQITQCIDTVSAYPPARQLLAPFAFPPEGSKLPELIAGLERYAGAPALMAQIDQKKAQLQIVHRQTNKVADKHPDVPWLQRYRSVMLDGDFAAARESLSVGEAYMRQHEAFAEFHRLDGVLSEWSPQFAKDLRTSEGSDKMIERLRTVRPALNWFRAAQQVDIRPGADIAQLDKELTLLEEKIYQEVRTLAAARAWDHALSGHRITARMRKNLVEYAQSVKRLGKGTGKYADQQLREVRRALDNCREAVPVWIMPLHRIIDQLDVQSNMFDVVMVDEASQAGAEACFLQYLAPSIIVIGDDKQVSPSAVGVREEDMRKLADHYLDDDEDKAGWADPKRSLFDVASARFGGTLTLTEHRRCVPEIIGFSNQLTYEPDDITLTPVREVPADRLAPFKIVHTPYGRQERSGKINRGEADALIAQLCECINDPTYADKTIGVISLLSSSRQADYIQTRLMEQLPAEVWEKHNLRVGTPAEFQGAERDVMFLSMVAAKDENKRLPALTSDVYVQRYNVAVSRAKDQVWLFHSVGMDELTNPEDVRYKLLKYAYGVATHTVSDEKSERVSDDDRVGPFNSLFEQRVYNAIVDRGYRVIPQFDAHPYRIDLVVQGTDARLAVECDGDHWRGLEYIDKDLRRQRDLERLGWRFVRIFESDYYLDKQAQLEKIWRALDDMGITPHHIHNEVDPSDSIMVLSAPM